MKVLGLFAAAAALAVTGVASAQPPGAVRMPAAPRARQQAPPTTTEPTAPAEKPDITIRSWADRTAVWVGDRVTFNVEVQCAPTVDVVSDDFGKEKLRLEGLEVVDAQVERLVAESGEATHRFRYVVTTYETSAPVLRISEWKVRYGARRAGQRVDDTSSARELTVPGVTLALRSTIPEELTTADARDGRNIDLLPSMLALARPVGLTLAIASVAPVVFWTAALVHRKLPKERRPRDSRSARNATRSALEELQATGVEDEAARREAYGRLNTVMRQHVATVAGLPAAALSPAEIDGRLRASASPLPLEAMSTVLGECERALYGPPDLLPTAEAFRSAVGTAEQALARR